MLMHYDTNTPPGKFASAIWILAAALVLPCLTPVNKAWAAVSAKRHIQAAVPIAGPDTWGAVDGMGRVLPDYRQVGPVKKNKTAAIFYFINRSAPGHAILNNDLMLQKHPHKVIGPLYSTHWWAEPLFGYYRSSDPFVLREHAAMLGDAGINTVIFDNTNGPTYFKVQKALFKTWLHMKALGNPVPDFACFAGNGAWSTDYRTIYKAGLAKELWFYWDGKPLMLFHGKKGMLPLNVKHFFTLRYCWAWTGGKNKWGWDNLMVSPKLYGWHKSPSVPEEMPVAVAGWANTSVGRSYSNGHQPPRSEQQPGVGICFAQQWRSALTIDPAFIFITGFNEWTAGCWPAPGRQYFLRHWVGKGAPIFVDEYSPEYSRDIEPMLRDAGGLYGGFGDNYYYQMVAELRHYKGVHRLPKVQAAVIHIRGPMSQWKRVGPLFYNNAGLAVHRNYSGWGKEHYVNESGRNEIVASKFAYGKKSLYFWVKTVKPITSWHGKSWMLLYLSVPHNGHAGNWMGYNYIIDRRVVNGQTAVVERNTGNGYQWHAVGMARFQVRGNQMQMAVPRSALGIPNALPNEIHFKWADHTTQDGKWTDFYLNGDCAPPFRFYYRAKIR